MKQSAVSILLAGMVLLSTGATGFAQFSADSPLGVSAGLAKLFGSVTGFVAKADVQVLDPAQQESLRTPMGFAFLDGRMRMEIDMSQMKGKAAQPEMVAALKRGGLDRVVSIIRLDQKQAHLIFPGARSYVDAELSKADAEAAGKNLQIQKTALGHETAEGHPCAKNKVLVKNSQGTALLEAITWNATDLQEFPVRIAVQARDNTTVLHFKQIQMVKPPAAQFEPPAGYAKFSSTEALMVGASQKLNAPQKSTAPAPARPKSVGSKKAPAKP